MTSKYYLIIHENLIALKTYEIQKSTTEEIKTVEDLEIHPPLSTFEPPCIEECDNTITVHEQEEFILDNINEINKDITEVMDKTPLKKYGFYLGYSNRYEDL